MTCAWDIQCAKAESPFFPDSRKEANTSTHVVPCASTCQRSLHAVHEAHTITVITAKPARSMPAGSRICIAYPAHHVSCRVCLLLLRAGGHNAHCSAQGCPEAQCFSCLLLPVHAAAGCCLRREPAADLSTSTALYMPPAASCTACCCSILQEGVLMPLGAAAQLRCCSYRAAGCCQHSQGGASTAARLLYTQTQRVIEALMSPRSSSTSIMAAG
jgi:hypothetical protein